MIEILNHVGDRTPAIAQEDALSALESLLSDKPDNSKLAKMPGWGLLVPLLVPPENASNALLGRSERFKDLLNRLDVRLTDTAYLSTNAFDTHPLVARLLVDKMVKEGIGKKPTKILFPACGTGIFALAFQAYYPEVYRNLRITAVDIDPIRCQIFKALNPSAEVVCKPFQDYSKSLPEGSFHVVLDNVPFGSNKVNDRPIHCFFLKEMTRLTTPKGMVGCLVSTGFMNSPGNNVFRVEQEGLADLVYYFPIPQKVHKTMGTDTAIDVLLFVKK